MPVSAPLPSREDGLLKQRIWHHHHLLVPMEPKPKKDNVMPSSNDDEDDVKIPALPSAADDYSTANNEEEAAAIVAASTTAAARPYVYQDYAQDDTDYGGDHDISTVVQDGRGLTNQKLPAKLAAMLSDPGE